MSSSKSTKGPIVAGRVKPTKWNPHGYSLLVDQETVTSEKEDAEYFDSYADIAIHDTMIKDYVRTASYRRAFLEHGKEIFQDKVVLDCGCGTGILSFFAIQAGAKKVYAVDACNMAHFAKRIVASNKLEDKIIVYQSKIEDLELPEKVDVIISEWMGYFLIYESMLQSVIYARDKWLKPDGIMYPSSCRLHLAPLSAPEIYNDRIHYWRDVWGINMSSIELPLIDPVDEDCIIGPSVCIKEIDCNTVRVEDIEKTFCQFRFKPTRAGQLNGFVSWFDVSFTPPSLKECKYLPLIYTESDQDEYDQFYDPYSHPEDPFFMGNKIITPNANKDDSTTPSNPENEASTSSTSDPGESDDESNSTNTNQLADDVYKPPGWTPKLDAQYTGKRPVLLSTSPEVGYTHWSAVQFWFDNPVNLARTDIIEGAIRVTPFPGKKRSLKIDIGFDSSQQTKHSLRTPRPLFPPLQSVDRVLSGSSQSTAMFNVSKSWTDFQSSSVASNDTCAEISLEESFAFSKSYEL